MTEATSEARRLLGQVFGFPDFRPGQAGKSMDWEISA
jgi:hypothetical protein